MTAVRENPDSKSFLEYNDCDLVNEIKVGSLHHRVSKKRNRAFSLKTETRPGARPQQRFFLRDAIHPQDLAYVVVVLQRRIFRLGPDASIRRLDPPARVGDYHPRCAGSLLGQNFAESLHEFPESDIII